MSEGSRARKRCDLRNIIGLLMGVGAASTAAAQTVPTTITIDSSFGRTPGQLGPTATNTTVTGNRGATYNVTNLYTIAESQGRTAGANLFHSFGTFNVGTGDAAVFTTATPSLQNIIARVSGPSASTIQGLLAVNAAAGSNPNLFFINPAGVTFGTGAIVDVPAAFHVSTANELRFADGTAFKAGVGPDSSMTMAAPEAFGFVGGNANIAFNGVQADGQEGRAAFAAGSLDVTAGGVIFDGSSISAPQTRVRLLGAGAMASSIPIDTAPSAAPQGDLRLTASSINTTAERGAAGDILLIGRDIRLDDASFDASFIVGSEADGTGVFQSGAAGTIRITAAGDVELRGRTGVQAIVFGRFVMDARGGTIEIDAQGDITSDTTSLEESGPLLRVVSITSAQVTPGDGIILRGRSVSLRRTGLLSSTLRGGQSEAGDIQVEAPGKVQIIDSSLVSDGSSSAAGDIRVRADAIEIGGVSTISSSLIPESRSTLGGVGSITFDAASQVIIGPDAFIFASTAGRFDNPENAPPGQIRINTPLLQLAGMISAATASNADASNVVFDGGNAGLIVQGAGLVTSSTVSEGDAGSITLLGRDVTVEGVRLQSASVVSRSTAESTTGAAGRIQVIADNQFALTGAQLQTDTATPGKAGNINLTGRAGTIDASQIQSQASVGSTGQAGTIAVSASESLHLTNSTLNVASDALSPDPTGIAQGLISVDAPTLTVRSSLITAESSMNVSASAIEVNADSNLTLDQATVSSTARGTAAAGDIAITSNGAVTLRDSAITGEAVAANTSQLTITGTDVLLDGTSRLSTRLVGGPAMTDPTTTTGGVGAIRVAGTHRIAVGAASSIDASAVGSFANPDRATPGEVRLTTPQLDVAGTITTATFGNVTASNIVVESGSALSITGSGVLTSSTAGTGNAGNIDIGANDVALASTTVTSATTGDGAAGTVTLHAANRLAATNATVRTDTAGGGKAGNVAFTARTITIDPSLISSQAASGSSGQTGTIDVSATNAIELRDSTLSIANAARVADPGMTPLGRIRLGAPVVKLLGSNVTAQSSENVGASAITINAPNALTIRNSNVTTSAQDGNGGNIDILGQRFIVLDKSQINTSVLGSQSGSGGNITVRANVMVANNGFIQANTAAAGASGGNVVIDVGQLLPVGTVVTGGDVPLPFDAQRTGINAIQAAAPDGVSGTIQLAGPSLDVVGNLQRVEAEFVAAGPLGQDLCRQGNGSSLTQLGRGGLRPLSTGLLRPDTSLPLLPELPTLGLQLTQQPSSGKCGH